MKTYILAQVLLTAVLWLLFCRESENLAESSQFKARIAVKTAKIQIERELSGLWEDAALLATYAGSRDTSTAASNPEGPDDLPIQIMNLKYQYLDAGLIDPAGRVDSFTGGTQRPSSGKVSTLFPPGAANLAKGEVWLSGTSLKFDMRSSNPVAVISAISPLANPAVAEPAWVYLDLRVNHLGQILRRVSRHIGTNVELVDTLGARQIGSDGAGALETARLDGESIPGLATTHPDMWDRVRAEPASGNHYTGHFWVSHARLEPDARQDRGWLVISYRDQPQIQALLRPLQLGYFLAWCVLSALLAFWTYYAKRRGRLTRRRWRKLAESEERFRLIVDSAPDAIMVVDPAGRIQFANEQSGNWFGYAANELVGQSVEMLVPTERREAHKLSREDFAKGPRVRPMGAGMELYGQRKDGRRFPVEISLSPIDVGGKKYITAIVRDISGRQNLEKARQKLADRYRQMVEYLPVGVFRAEGDRHTCFREANTAMLELLAAPKMEALRNLKIKDLLVEPADRASLENALQVSSSVKQFEALLRRLDGSHFFGLISCTEGTDESGSKHFEGVIKDISARKRYEVEIQRLNETLTARTSELEFINHELEAFSYSVSHDLQVPLRAIDSSVAILLRDYGDRLDQKGLDRLERIQTTSQRMSRLFDDLLNLYRVSRANIHWRSVDFTALAEEIVTELQSSEPERRVRVNIQRRMWGNADPHLIRVALMHLMGNAWKFTAKTPNAEISVGCDVENGEAIYFVRDNGAGFEPRFVDKLFSASQRLHNEEEYPGTGMGLATVERILHRHGGRIWAHSEVNKGSTFFFQIGPAHRNGRPG